MSDFDLDDLAGELADFAPAKKKQATYTAREERVIAGFEDIERFYEEHGRLPEHGEGKDIFERIYAVRLDRLRAIEDCRELLASFDKHGLLEAVPSAQVEDDLDAEDLAAELAGLGEGESITELRHVRSAEEKRAAEDIARRERCLDFDKFVDIFKQVKEDLANSTRVTRPFELKAEIRPGAFFIVGGQIAYVAEMDEIFSNAQGRTDARLRVIFDNGTESGMLMRSLQRQLHDDDDAGRRITDPAPGPLFADQAEEGELETGTIYVLRSNSDHPSVLEHRNVMHKIGVTSGSVEGRIAGAEKSSTYLLSTVEVVATYKVYGVNCQKLENLLHKVFGAGQINLSIPDRFGNTVKPREWFLVPLNVIDEAVQRIRDRSILKYRYDPQAGQLVNAFLPGV